MLTSPSHSCTAAAPGWSTLIKSSLKPNYSLTFSGFFAKKTKKFTYVQSPPQLNNLKLNKFFSASVGQEQEQELRITQPVISTEFDPFF